MTSAKRNGLFSRLNGRNSKTTREGIAWNTLYSAVSMVLNFVVGVVLARLIEPSEFGAVAVVLALSTFINAFVDGGFGSVIVQSRTLKQNELPTLFTINLLVAIIFSIILYSLSDVIGTYYESQKVSLITKAIIVVYIFQAFIVVPKNYLIRSLDFRAIALIEVTAVTLSGIVAIILAMNLFGYWAIVSRVIVQFLVAAISYMIVVKPSLRLELRKKVLSKYWRYGSGVLFHGLFSNLKSKLDIFLVGKLLTTDVLGIYTRGKQYATMPQTFLYNVFNKTLFSSFARIEQNKFTSYYLHWFRLLSVVSFFVFFLVFLLADLFVINLLGEEWRDSVIILRVFVFWGSLKVLVLFNVDIFNTKGKPGINTRVAFIELVVFLGAVALFWTFGNRLSLAFNLAIAVLVSVMSTIVLQLAFLAKFTDTTFLKLCLCNVKEFLILLVSLIVAHYIGDRLHYLGGVLEAILRLSIFSILVMSFGMALKNKPIKYLFNKIQLKCVGLTASFQKD